LAEGVTEGRRELQEQQRPVILATDAVPWPGTGAVFRQDVVGGVVESGA
jgi:hypothetical protein